MDWKHRKLASLQRMAAASDSDIAMAFAGDKAATLLELEWDCAHIGHSMVLKGLRDGDQLLWYYRSCVNALSNKVPQAMRSVLQQKLTWLNARLKYQPTE
jgi:propanediol dehydratase large subunit